MSREERRASSGPTLFALGLFALGCAFYIGHCTLIVELCSDGGAAEAREP